MRDRSKELELPENDSESDETKVLMKLHDDELDEHFFDMVRQIRESLQLLRSKVKKLESSQMKVLSQPFPEDSMMKDLQSLRDEVKLLAKDIRGKLQTIEMKDDEAKVRGSVHKRMKKSQHGVLSQQFIEIINQCNLIQTQYRDSNVKRIKRQLQITGHRLTDNQFDDMLESGQSDIFTCNLLKDTQITKQALNEIESRHDEIVKLEKCISDLHDMFTLLATEVENQGETIDSIEKNVLSSSDYIVKSKEQLEQAVENRNKARKKKMYIALCVTILVFILIIIITVSVMS